MIIRLAAFVVVCATITAAPPAVAITVKQKAEICKFGADDQKLSGAARKKFIAKCMAPNDTPARQQKNRT